MKKILVTISLLAVIILAGVYFYLSTALPKDENTIFLNAHNENAYQKLLPLKKFIKANNRSVYLSRPNKFQSGKYNLYTAPDIKHLPSVLDADAINILWIDVIEKDKTVEALRPFDVIVVKGIPAFNFLKAINIRTAYIPEAINMRKIKRAEKLKDAMYYGDDGNNHSLTTYLIKSSNLNLDIYGKNYEQYFSKKNIAAPAPNRSDFHNYSLVLTDQSEEEIKNELVNQKVIQIIENGGLPYVRYNPGIEKMFGDIIPMYHNELEFTRLYNELMYSPYQVRRKWEKLQQENPKWNSDSQAKKIIELFEVMQKKRIPVL